MVYSTVYIKKIIPVCNRVEHQKHGSNIHICIGSAGLTRRQTLKSFSDIQYGYW